MKTILFVEDDPIIVQVYRGPLQNAGFQVEVAEDGLVAMKVILQLQPDLVLLDVMMPKVEGTYVLKFIRSRPELSGTKVIILSNVTNSDVAAAVYTQKPDRVFTKSQATPREVIKAAIELLGDGTSAPQSA